MIEYFFDMINIIITESICCLITLSLTKLPSNVLGGKYVFSLLKMTMLSFVLPLHKLTDKIPNLLFSIRSAYPKDLAITKIKLAFQNIVVFSLFLYVTTSVMLIARFVMQQRAATRNLLDYSVPTNDENILNMVSELSSRIDLKKKIDIYLNPDISGAVLVGIGKPIIILSANIQDEEDCRYYLLHELYHCKRHHTLYKTLAALLRCVQWFNPLAAKLSKEINAWSELACDEDAITHLNRRERLSYAKLIVDSIERNLSTNISVTMFSSKTNLQRRIQNIMNTKESLRKKVGASLLTIALLSTSFIPVQAANGATIAIQDKAASVAFDAYATSDEPTPESMGEIVVEGPDLSEAKIFENPYTRGPISSTVASGHTISSQAHTMSIGQKVGVTFNTNVTGKVTIGLLQPDGMSRTATSTANGFIHTFTITQNGTHYIYITNNSSSTMTMVGTIVWN